MSHRGLENFLNDLDAINYIVSQRWERIYSNATLHRGELIYTDSLVSALDVTALSDSFSIEGMVQGNRKKPYATRVSLLKNHRGYDIFSVCSCPVGSFCKHAVAVLCTLEEALQSLDAEQTAPDNVVSNWLNDIAVSISKKDEAKAKKKPVRQAYALAYILSSHTDGTLTLRLGKTKQNKNGDVYVDNDYFIPSIKHKTPAYFQEGDYENAFAIIYKLPEHIEYWEGILTADFTDLLEKLLQTGRLYSDEEFERRRPISPLREGPSLHVSPSWEATPSGLYKPTLGDDALDVQIHPLKVNYYLNSKKGVVGKVETPDGLPPHILSIWPKGPSVAAAEAGALCQKMENLGIPVTIPRPLTLPEEIVSHSGPLPQLTLSRQTAISHVKIETFGGVSRTVLPPQIVAEISFLYAEHTVKLGARQPTVKIITPEVIKIIERSETAELKKIAALREWGISPLNNQFSSDQITPGYNEAFAPDSDPSDWDTFWVEFIRTAVPQLKDLGWNVTIEDSAELNVITADEIFSDFSEDEERGIDWFRFDSGIVNSDGQRVSLLNLIAHFLKTSKTIPPDDEIKADERIVLTDPVKKTYFDLPAKRFFHIVRSVESLFNSPDEGIHRLEAARVADDLQLDTTGTMADLRALGQQLASREPHKAVPIPKTVKTSLRDYQKDGFQWLQFLARHHLHGILADDMGLGKTIQTLTHIAAEIENKRTEKRPILVVAPTSVVPNWVSEAEKFTPHLKVLLLHGNERKDHFKKITKHDLVITSYALLQRDEAIHLKKKYHLVILDEAQYIKNPKAKVSITASQLNARHRLCLSGTPMENHLGELWSLSRFLMPGLLGTQSAFNQHYKNPIERQQDPDAQTSLNARITPLILRRTKDQVIQELPAKTVLIHRVKLTKPQQDLYESVRTAMDKRVRDAIEDRGLARSQILVLDALLKLRQICCHPQLIKTEIAKKVTESAKLDFLVTLLETLIEEGRRILIFSQFTTMLKMIEEHLQQNSIPFVKITGATRNRKTPVEKFQTGQIPVFLISLKAGGTGLNLTAADTVIHYDPWWNPAAENQATDRAHRIGQKNPVFVHKLICEGSIEERILELQAKKSKLVDALLSKETSKVNLDTQTLENLLAPLD